MKTIHSCRNRAFCAAVIASITWSASASAQTLATTPTALNRFEPSERGSDWFANESLDLRGKARPALGVVGDYGYKGYVLENPDGTVNTDVIEHQFYVHVGGSLVLFDRLRLGLSLPIAVAQEGESKIAGGRSFVAPTSGGVGDLRIAADLRLLGEYGDAFTMALGGRLWVPTGDESQYIGDGRARIGPRLSAAGDIGAFAYSAGLGAVYRVNDTAFAGHATGSEVTFNAAMGVRVADRKLLLGPEIFGSTIVTKSEAVFGNHTTPLALMIGGHYDAGDVRFGLGAGPGLSNAAGTAAFRTLASIEWMPAIEKAKPPPPPAPAPAPPPPEPAPPPPAPPPPPPDRDGDSVIDAEDACPDVAGIKTDDPKTSGCPSDRDKDGIADTEDACPDASGPRNADPKKNGCPFVRIEAGQVKILEQIKFKTNSAEIVDSQPIVEAVTATLKDHPEIKHLRIEGHTDNVGAAAYNKELSRRRAASVEKTLVKAGVDKRKLSSQGFGFEKPIDDNTTDTGRAANRRVEFHIEDTATNPAPAKK